LAGDGRCYAREGLCRVYADRSRDRDELKDINPTLAQLDLRNEGR